MTTPPPQRRPGRPAQGDAPALSDDACLDVALAAFAERGFEGASIREIARAAGISAAEAASALLELNLAGRAELLPGGLVAAA